MNILFQWLRKNISVIAIGISLVSLILSITALMCASINTPKKKKINRLKKLWSARYTIFHIVSFVCLTIYVLVNWKECISMQLFKRFNGNNILFLVWIVLIFLIIYEVKGKGVKIAKRKQEEDQQNLSVANLTYKLDTMQEQIRSSNPNLDDTYQSEEGGQQNGLPD